jgi:hypothetical protein
MAIDIECQSCGKKLRVKDELAGKKGKCPGCGAIIDIPAPASDTYDLAGEKEEQRQYVPVTAQEAKAEVLPSPFTADRYVARRKVFKFFGAKFHLYDVQGTLIGVSKQKAFKLKEDIRLYSDEQMSKELLWIQARQILDISAAYDVVDSASGKKIGAFRRKGIKSAFLRDEWDVLDVNDRPIGMLQEESSSLALIRRYIGGIVNLLAPQKYNMLIGGQLVGTLQQNYNPFVLKYAVDFSMDTAKKFSRSLGVAAAILLAAIERRQG